MAMAGTGGQGLLTIGKILLEAGMSDYKHVVYFPFYTAAIRDVVGTTPEKEIEQELSWLRKWIHEKILEKPGIGHTELLRSIEASRAVKESVISHLLDERKIECDQKGRSRKHSARQGYN